MERTRHLGRLLKPHIKSSIKRHATQDQGPHTTYFQPPPQPPKPPRRIFRTVLFGTTFLGLGAYANSWFHSAVLSVDMAETLMDGGEAIMTAMAAAAQDTAARQVPGMDLVRAQEYLELRSGFAVGAKVVTHTCQLPSNLPCEDTEHIGEYTFLKDRKIDWLTWSIFDGHCGPRTSQLLKEFLPEIVGKRLYEAQCMDRAHVSNNTHIVRTIQRAFTDIDKDIVQDAADQVKAKLPLAASLAVASPALSGSCALLSLYDPVKSILRVANTGDSRAVLGRWDKSANRYTAVPLSVDQTGFNQSEVERLKKEHPGEDPVDPKTGRVLGMMISRAFGDSRWKWPQEVSQLAHDKLWGPDPRPEGLVKTPPYLTAEPEVTETRVHKGDNPDFLIMASDGLWDNISSEDAVTCVQQWLTKNKSTDFIQKLEAQEQFSFDRFTGSKPDDKPKSRPRSVDMSSDEDTYYDADEKIRKWRVTPKNFVNEDDNCSVHLIKNALGGNRRDLFLGLMSLQPPLSRAARDDITVHVIFFGADTKDAASGR